MPPLHGSASHEQRGGRRLCQGHREHRRPGAASRAHHGHHRTSAAVIRDDGASDSAATKSASWAGKCHHMLRADGDRSLPVIRPGVIAADQDHPAHDGVGRGRASLRGRVRRAAPRPPPSRPSAPEGSSTRTSPTPAAAATRDTSSRSGRSPMSASTVPAGVIELFEAAAMPSPCGLPRGRHHHQSTDCG